VTNWHLFCLEVIRINRTFFDHGAEQMGAYTTDIIMIVALGMSLLAVVGLITIMKI
jgi:hypothetical protein